MKEDAVYKLKKWREENIKNSKEVVELFSKIIQPDILKYGNESWLIYEQVLIAALDCKNIDLAKKCFHALEKKFPKSLRVAKLYGYILEYYERFDDAEEIYDALLAKDPSNSLIYKRKVALLKARNSIPEAIIELNAYLKIFMNDLEAWHELCDLYLVILDYEKAAFCMEELILSNSRNYFYHMKYAEIKYSQGGNDNLELSRSHYCFAYKLNPTNARSLYGIILVSNALQQYTKGNIKKHKENQICFDWASNQLNQLYGQHKKRTSSKEDSTLNLLGPMLASLQLNTA